MSTCSPVLVEIVSIPVAPILVEEVIALTNRCCTCWNEHPARICKLNVPSYAHVFTNSASLTGEGCLDGSLEISAPNYIGIG